MKKIKKKLFIGIFCALFVVTLFQEVGFNGSNKCLFGVIVEAMAQGEAPENGTCCPRSGNECTLKHVTIVNSYLKEAYTCK